MTVEVPEPESKFYTVKSGDNLSKISKEFMAIQTNTIKFLKRINHYSKMRMIFFLDKCCVFLIIGIKKRRIAPFLFIG
jgi:hypothetical protein